MKKTMIFTLFIMIIAFAGCGMNKEAKLEAKTETETNVNDYIEEVVVEEPVVSDEYLQELEYNSQENVYFEER